MGKAKRPGSLGVGTLNPLLQFAVADGSGEGQHVPDVAHTGQVHDAALKAKAEAGVTGGAVLPQIQIEAVVLGIQTQLVHAGKEGIVIILTLAAADAQA